MLATCLKMLTTSRFSTRKDDVDSKKKLRDERIFGLDSAACSVWSMDVVAWFQVVCSGVGLLSLTKGPWNQYREGLRTSLNNSRLVMPIGSSKEIYPNMWLSDAQMDSFFHA